MNYKYRLVVIDDEPSREENYKSLLKNSEIPFTLEFINSTKKLVKINDIKADGYIIDLFLSDWGMTANDVIKKIKIERPIILVSANWTSTEVNPLEVLNEIKAPVCYFLGWDEFFQKSGEEVEDFESRKKTTRWKISLELDKFFRRSAFIPAANEVLNIIHMSDTQFGDPHVDDKSFLSEFIIPETLREENIETHFLVITGDIAYSGQPHEYEEGLEWFMTMTNNLWPDQDLRERILLVPGNHDIDFRLHAADYYKYSLKEKQFFDNKLEYFEHVGFGLMPFKHFAFRLTNDIRWLNNNNQLCWINNSFRHIGLVFIIMNSACEITTDNPQKAAISETAMKNLVTSEKNKTLYRISLSHHGYKFDLKEEDKLLNKDKVENLLHKNKVNMFIHGHGHAFKACYEDKIVHVMSPSSHLKKEYQSFDDKRGFNLIQLQRKKGIVKKIRIVPYVLDGHDLVERTKRIVEFEGL